MKGFAEVGSAGRSGWCVVQASCHSWRGLWFGSGARVILELFEPVAVLELVSGRLQLWVRTEGALQEVVLDAVGPMVWQCKAVSYQ